MANILARLISSSLNYTINRKIVFNSNNGICTSATKYFLLALAIIINTIIIQVLVNYLFINELLAKLLAELILFVISWLIQRNFIFNSKEAII